MAKILWGKFLAYSTLIIGTGYGLMIATTPTEEQFYNKLSPELKKKVDEVRRQRAVMDAEAKDKLTIASEEEKVVWATDRKAPPAPGPAK